MPDRDEPASLGELERKLEALEQELQGTRSERAPVPATGCPARGRAHTDSSYAAALASAGAPIGAVRPPERAGALAAPLPAERPAPPATPPEDPAQGLAGQELGGLHAHLDELASFREQLERSARELMAEYDRLLGGLRAAADREQVAVGLEATVLDGMLTVDAGPFADAAGLAAFEHAVRALPGVRVRTYERSRALTDVVLGEPVAFGAALRRSSALEFTLARAVPGHVTLELR